jgi:hypothetical protein
MIEAELFGWFVYIHLTKEIQYEFQDLGIKTRLRFPGPVFVNTVKLILRKIIP